MEGLTLRKIKIFIMGLLCSLYLPYSIAASEPNQSTSQSEVLPLEDVQRFTTAIGQIKSYYVKDVTDKKLFENAIRGMLSGLDPHSAYLDADEFKDLQSSTRGAFGGLGIEVGMEGDYIKVISPIDDTPAYRAGLKPGDLIIRLDDTPVKGMTLRDAVKKMRGPQGSSIVLTIIRKKASKPITVTLIREVIKIKSVKSKMLEPGYAYLRVSHFQSSTADDVIKHIQKIKNKNKKINGLIIDLRNNPGGLLDSAIQISDNFIHNDQQGSEEVIVYTKGRAQGSKFKALATPGDILKGVPLIVLINQGSASASEIVAGALQDHRRAVLIGTKSFGKGSVQTVLPLDDRRGIKLTTALYYTPKGRSIQATGIVPDVIVENIDVKKAGDKNNLSVSEADLSGHLANGNGKPDAKSRSDKKDKSLVYSDFQLHHALSMLKSINALTIDEKEKAPAVAPQ